jgi:hypothetical protein
MPAMCPMRPIPPVFPMLFDLAEVVEHLVEDDMIEDSDAETVPWLFNADAAEFVPQHNGDTAPQTPRGNLLAPPRGNTRVWADMTDSDGEDVPQQETPAQRNARRLEELRIMSLQDIVVLDCFTYQAMNMETDGNTLVAEVHRFSAAHFGLDPATFILAYKGQPLANSMDVTSITEHDLTIDAVQAFHLIRRPVAINIEFRTVEHGSISLSVHLTDSVASLYTRIGFLTGWPLTAFTLRHENHTLDNWVLDVAGVGVSGDTFMVMVGALAGGTQRFNIGSPCAAAASRLDESDISDMDAETESSTSMPDMARLAVAIPMTSSKQVSSSPPPLPVLAGHCPLHLPSSSAAASGSAGRGSSAAAPPWCPSSPPMAGVSTLSVQGLKRTYAGAVDAAPGWTWQKSAARTHLEFPP